VKTFYQNHGCLPLPGSLPDMKAQSSVYVKLQNIYKAKARNDAQEVYRTVQSIPGGEKVDLGEVEIFCKNSRFVKLINASASDGDLGKVFGKWLSPPIALGFTKQDLASCGESKRRGS
jgi:amyloid beta precursor protein binding protein 1